jgi:hypothetical protein
MVFSNFLVYTNQEDRRIIRGINLEILNAESAETLDMIDYVKTDLLVFNISLV